MTATRLRGVAIGAGYFSQFHYDAWQRSPDVELIALCDRSGERARAAADRFGVPRVYADAATMIDAERPDFVDIITPPETHQALCALAGARGAHVLCQKALAPTWDAAVAIVEEAERASIRLMVHDNFRFQPWHREIRRLLDAGIIGQLQAIAARTRMGDGWQSDAYLSRQPYFRTMPQLLIFETGVHLIDVFRYLAGDVARVYARLHRRNPDIAGEDAGVLVLECAGGVTATWDASRYHESLCANPRYTFGEFLVEGERGAIRLDESGRMLVHLLGQPPREHAYTHEDRGFAGDCCYQTIRHFITGLQTGRPFETAGREYLKTLRVQHAAYRSAESGAVTAVDAPESGATEAGAGG
jgi:predicted dehydrogenase